MKWQIMLIVSRESTLRFCCQRIPLRCKLEFKASWQKRFGLFNSTSHILLVFCKHHHVCDLCLSYLLILCNPNLSQPGPSGLNLVTGVVRLLFHAISCNDISFCLLLRIRELHESCSDQKNHAVFSCLICDALFPDICFSQVLEKTTKWPALKYCSYWKEPVSKIRIL